MKAYLVFFFCLLCCHQSFSQDGSDIRYLKKIDASIIGDTVQLDFYRKSYGGLSIDTINIDVKSISQKFVEVRKDDGFNSWFSQQYLESVDVINGFKLRIIGWKVLDVFKDSILVLPRVEVILSKETLNKELLVMDKCLFPKSSIVEILVKTKQF